MVVIKNAFTFPFALFLNFFLFFLVSVFFVFCSVLVLIVCFFIVLLSYTISDLKITKLIFLTEANDKEAKMP